MNVTQQFYEMVAERYHEIERLKMETMERGEIVVNITDAYVKGEISEEDYNDLIARACGGDE